MTVHSVNKNTLALLDTDVYAVKRRADIMLTAAETKLEGRPTEKWRDLYTYICDCLYEVDNLPYLLSEKKFPESHYIWTGPKRITPKFFERKFKELEDRVDKLLKNAHKLNESIANDLTLIATIKPNLKWQDWLDSLEEIDYYIKDTKEIFI